MNNCGCKKNRYYQMINLENTNIVEMMSNYHDLTSNYELVSDYYSNSDSNIEEFRTMGNSQGGSRSGGSRSSGSRSSGSRSSGSRSGGSRSSGSRSGSSRSGSFSRNMSPLRNVSPSRNVGNSRPDFLKQTLPSNLSNRSSSSSFTEPTNPNRINYKGGSLVDNRPDIQNKTNSNNILQQTSTNISNNYNRYNDKQIKTNNKLTKNNMVASGLVVDNVSNNISSKSSNINTKSSNINTKSSNINTKSDTKTDMSTNILTSNDLKINSNSKINRDKNKLVLPSNIQSTYDDIISNTRGKIENKKWDNLDTSNYSNKYDKWKNKYYWNRGWKYRSGYWNDGYWNDGYWYYNPYLFYSYLGYPYPYPYTGYYYLEYPYLDNPITNIEQSQLDEIENKIDYINVNQNEEENNSEEFNKFLLDELTRLKIKLNELEKYKQEKENKILSDKKDLSDELISQVKSEIQNLDKLEDISDEIIKFLDSKIKEKNVRMSNSQIEKFSSSSFNYLPWIIVIVIILLVFVLRKTK